MKHHNKLRNLFQSTFPESKLAPLHKTPKAHAHGFEIRPFDVETTIIAGEPLHDLFKLRSITEVFACDREDLLADHKDALNRLSRPQMKEKKQTGDRSTTHARTPSHNNLTQSNRITKKKVQSNTSKLQPSINRRTTKFHLTRKGSRIKRLAGTVPCETTPSDAGTLGYHTRCQITRLQRISRIYFQLRI